MLPRRGSVPVGSLLGSVLFLDFLRDVNFLFTTAAPYRATVTQMGLQNSSIHFVECVRWKIFLRMLNKFKGSIRIGLDSIDKFVLV